MLGSVDSYDAVARDLAEASRMIVVAVGYRKAPEVRFPGPINVRISTAMDGGFGEWAGRTHTHNHTSPPPPPHIVLDCPLPLLATYSALLRFCGALGPPPNPLSTLHAMHFFGATTFMYMWWLGFEM